MAVITTTATNAELGDIGIAGTGGMLIIQDFPTIGDLMEIIGMDGIHGTALLVIV